MTFGTYLKEKRKLAGLTIAALADRIGVNSNSFGKWERDEVLPGLDNMARIAIELDLTPGQTCYALAASLQK